MKRFGYLLIGIVIMTNCTTNSTVEQDQVLTDKKDTTAVVEEFEFVIDHFADLKIMRYKIPGFEELTLQQKKLVYYLSEAALYGRDITTDQNYRHNLCIRRTLEAIVKSDAVDKNTPEYQALETYLKRVWFANGIHHHYSTEKFYPEFSQEYFTSVMATEGLNLPLAEGEDANSLAQRLIPLLFSKDVDNKRLCQDEGVDMIAASSNNFYEGVKQAEVESFYGSMKKADDPQPVSYGINSKVVKEKGVLKERVWKVGGMYSPAIEKIVECLEKAMEFAENDAQKNTIALLVEYYKTGDLKVWDDYNVAWVKDLDSRVDFVNGFIETYGDPMGMKATWESVVNFKDLEATKRAITISDNAQWFEDHSPVDDKFKKKEVKGVSAKVITVAQLGGDCYPSTPIGINLPNANWIRKDHGSKSVTMENITYAYDQASLGSGYLDEFAPSAEVMQRMKDHGPLAGNLHTDLHECLGHGSGQILPGVDPDALKNYGSALEETRADLFALYFLMDPKMVELGLIPSLEVAKAEYDSYISNGIMWQLKRVALGSNIEQAHMRNRQLISAWSFENGEGAIEKQVREGKTYFVINDYDKVRQLFGKLLAEVQRIKSEGDFEAGKALVEKYAVKVDPQLHQEMLDRYAKLNLEPYSGFINPVLVPVLDDKGEITDVKVEYPMSYSEQMLHYSEKYSPLPAYN